MRFPSATRNGGRAKSGNHGVSPKHLDDYLAEINDRANRRWLEANLFDRLIQAALDSKAITNKELVTGVS
ncbi:MAG: hypothetical protein JXQ73_22310 [Phycisphaerae bacterium]|nr:hypothetical protein [Phycisphaerae bacterium]